MRGVDSTAGLWSVAVARDAASILIVVLAKAAGQRWATHVCADSRVARIQPGCETSNTSRTEAARELALLVLLALGVLGCGACSTFCAH